MKPLRNLKVTEQLLRSIAGIDEFKGHWAALGNLAPERLSALRRIATIESIGSSTRIEGVKLTDDEIEKLLSGLDSYTVSCSSTPRKTRATVAITRVSPTVSRRSTKTAAASA